MPEKPRTTPSGESDQQRAEILRSGIPYVRGWAQAHSATLALAQELRALGLEADFAYMRADVTTSGEGVVRLDLVTAEAARRLVELLTLGLCTEIERLPAVQPTTARIGPIV